MKKNKKKKILIISISCAAAVAVCVALLFLIGPLGKGITDVYSVADLVNVDLFGDAQVASGNIRTEGFQNVMVSDTQSITSIFVKEGQKVNKGDSILSYDSTLSDLELERAQLEVNRLTLELEKEKKTLAKIETLQPGYVKLIKPDNSKLHFDPVETPYKMSGKGTKKDPVFLIVKESEDIDTEYLKQIMPKNKKKLYAVFLYREHDAVNGKITDSFGLVLNYDGEKLTFRSFTPKIPKKIAKYDKPKKPYYKHFGSLYTAEEIAELKKETEKDIRETELELRSENLEYQMMAKEVEDSVVKAKRDGVVQVVRNPQLAYLEGLPVVEISSGGGYYLDIGISEMDLSEHKSGDKVTVETFSSCALCEGTIEKIELIPMKNPESYSSGNRNVSYYPCTIFIDASEHLESGEYAEVTFAEKEEEDIPIYLENMFIRHDSKGAYVLAEDLFGRIEKRYVTTGKVIYGSQTEIKEGLTLLDYIAFPYGKKAKVGAKANETTTDSLYSY